MSRLQTQYHCIGEIEAGTRKELKTCMNTHYIFLMCVNVSATQTLITYLFPDENGAFLVKGRFIVVVDVEL